MSESSRASKLQTTILLPGQSSLLLIIDSHGLSDTICRQGDSSHGSRLRYCTIPSSINAIHERIGIERSNVLQGLATAKYLAVRGASLSLADLNHKALDSLAASIKEATPNAEVHVTTLDVRKRADVQKWISSTLERFGKLSGAANLAGVVGKSLGTIPVVDIEEEEWDFIMDVNLKGTFNCLQAELKSIEDGGSIVNTASIAGVRGLVKYVFSLCLSPLWFSDHSTTVAAKNVALTPIVLAMVPTLYPNTGLWGSRELPRRNVPSLKSG